MADFEEELRLDDEENAREVEYIREVLPADLKEKFSEADLRYMMDTIVDYYFTSGVLEAEADADGFVDIDLQKVADYVCAKAAEQGQGDFDPAEVFFVVQADMDFQEQNLDRAARPCLLAGSGLVLGGRAAMPDGAWRRGFFLSWRQASRAGKSAANVSPCARAPRRAQGRDAGAGCSATQDGLFGGAGRPVPHPQTGRSAMRWLPGSWPGLALPPPVRRRQVCRQRQISWACSLPFTIILLFLHIPSGKVHCP